VLGGNARLASGENMGGSDTEKSGVHDARHCSEADTNGSGAVRATVENAGAKFEEPQCAAEPGFSAPQCTAEPLRPKGLRQQSDPVHGGVATLLDYRQRQETSRDRRVR